MSRFRLNQSERAWVLYDVANSAYTLTIVTAIGPIFFKSFAAASVAPSLSTAFWGYANSAMAVIIALLSPILGSFADYKNRKKVFLGFFILLGVLATFALSASKEGAIFMFLALYVISRMGFAGANIFYDALIVDVTSDDRMDQVSSQGFAWGYIGSVLPFLLGIALIQLADSLPFLAGFENPTVVATRISFVIVGLWWGLLSIPIMTKVKQTYHLESTGHTIRDSFARLGKTFKEISNYKNIAMFLLAYFFYIDGVGTIISMATAYGTDVGLSSTILLVIVLAIQIVAFPFALIFGRLSKRFSSKSLIMAGIIIYIVITFVGFLMPSFEKAGLSPEQYGQVISPVVMALFWILAFLVGVAQGGIQALSRSFFGQMIPKDKSAEFFGFYNIFGKFAAILGPFAMGYIGQVTGSSRWGILSLVVLFVVGAILLLKVPEPQQEQITQASPK